MGSFPSGESREEAVGQTDSRPALLADEASDSTIGEGSLQREMAEVRESAEHTVPEAKENLLKG
jgi:hypothetical protein